MEFTLKIKSGNSVFEDFPTEEVSRIMLVCSKRLERGDLEGKLFDINGNNVGEYALTGGN